MNKHECFTRFFTNNGEVLIYPFIRDKMSVNGELKRSKDRVCLLIDNYQLLISN
jgi:hypothetical protein